MTLQALRHRVGEDAFWTILRTWLADRGRRQRQHRASSRRWPSTVSGQDLDGFFHAWLVATTRPEHTADNGLG